MDNNRAEFGRWFSQAERDLKAARSSLKGGYFEWSCFQSQQAAEKALKAFLALKGRRGLLTHSVFALLKESVAVDKRFGELRDCKELDQYYVPTRYPGVLPDGAAPFEFYRLEEADRCASFAARILARVRESSQ